MDLDFTKPHVCFWVAGIPAPGGSKRFMGIGKRTGRAILIDAGGERNKNWRANVTATASEKMTDPPLHGALFLKCEFIMPRPKNHFHTSKKKAGRLREDAPHWHVNAPDATKLLRSTEDAMKGITWIDDSQVAFQSAKKTYGEKPGCLITIFQL